MQYRKKPVVIEAFQWLGYADGKPITANWPQWACDAELGTSQWMDVESLVIETLEGNMVAGKGDWIIRGVKGELYPCKPDIFAMTYEEVT